MSRNDLNMEDLFRTQMESYQVDPSPGLWQKVHAKILLKQFMTFSFQTFNVYYLAALISIAGIGIFALLSDLETIPEKIQIQSSNEFQAVSPSVESEVSNSKNEEAKEPLVQSAQKVEKKSELHTEGTASKKVEEEKVSENTSSVIPVKKKAEEPAAENPSSLITDPIHKKSESIIVKADFTASQLSGCSPLAVSFTNYSENAARFTWVFGDGGSSTEKDPSYVFDEPGEYPVLLRIIGKDDLEYSSQQIITVFESPKALFEMDDDVDLSSKQPVYFYNYSKGTEFYKWKFGDGQESNLVEPIHYYENAGNYNIVLIVWTHNQCYDSLVITNAFTGPESEIHFPNAFIPNLSGPTGGTYDINDISNSVFHPVVSGELVEYQLKIFNRQGLQVFESTDVSMGWDGYYQEKLAGQAVYIWKARGKFSNGKTFVKSGDITLVKPH